MAKIPTTFRLPEEKIKALRDIKCKDGISLTYQIEAAIGLWIKWHQTYQVETRVRRRKK
jgi:hypothetical protein